MHNQNLCCLLMQPGYQNPLPKIQIKIHLKIRIIITKKQNENLQTDILILSLLMFLLNFRNLNDYVFG